MIKLFHNLILILCFWILMLQVNAQSKPLTIEEGYGLTRKNYPMIRQRELISKTKDYLRRECCERIFAPAEYFGAGYLPVGGDGI
jgi:hypothetical protein